MRPSIFEAHAGIGTTKPSQIWDRSGKVDMPAVILHMSCHVRHYSTFGEPANSSINDIVIIIFLVLISFACIYRLGGCSAVRGERPDKPLYAACSQEM